MQKRVVGTGTGLPKLYLGSGSPSLGTAPYLKCRGGLFSSLKAGSERSIGEWSTILPLPITEVLPVTVQRRP